MSHFDDVDFLFWGRGPSGPIAGLLFSALLIVALVWSCAEDGKSSDTCTAHGERYVDSRVGYTLCEQDGGTVVRR